MKQQPDSQPDTGAKKPPLAPFCTLLPKRVADAEAHAKKEWREAQKIAVTVYVPLDPPLFPASVWR